MRINDPTSGESRFSKRRKRFDSSSDAREFTFSCYHRFPFLARPRVQQWFGIALQKARERWPVDVWAYCLMSEHVHLLVRPREAGLELGRFAGFVKEHTARP